MVINWRTAIKYFVTFEEITKSDLDSYFAKINKELYTSKALEWSTAQLGHFWIELKIKDMGSGKQPAFEQNSNFNGSGYDKVKRQESQENRLNDDPDEPVNLNQVNQQKSGPVDISLDRRDESESSKSASMNQSDHPKQSNKLIAESISDNSKDESQEVFEIIEEQKSDLVVAPQDNPAKKISSLSEVSNEPVTQNFTKPKPKPETKTSDEISKRKDTFNREEDEYMEQIEQLENLKLL